MPENVEVAIIAQYLLEKLKKYKLTSMMVLSGRYTHGALEGDDLLTLNGPFKISDINSKGKFMWFTLLNNKKSDIFIMNTLGLTGEWGFEKGISTRIAFTFVHSNGREKTLYYSDQRNFGTIKITSDINDLMKKTNKLAPDALKTKFTDEEFYNETLEFINKYPKQKNKEIVKILMEQDVGKGILSGIGNYLSADILNFAQISPHRKLNSLSEDEIYDLGHAIKYTTKLAYYNNTTGYMQTMLNYVEKHRNDILDKKLPNYHSDIKLQKNAIFSFRVYQQDHDPDGNPVIGEEIIKGRRTYWAPLSQH